MQENTMNFKKTLPVCIWILAALFYFYDFFLQVSPSVMVHELMRDFGVNATAIGNLVAIYFWVYALMQIPVGVIVDRFGAKKALLTATFTCALGCLLFAEASQFWQIQTGRFFIGLGSAFAAVCCMKIATIWFKPKRFALLTGIMVTIGMLGAMSGEAPLALLIGKLHWQKSIMLFAGIGAVLFVLIFIIIKDKAAPTKLNVSRDALLNGLKNVVLHKQNWFIACYGGLMFAPTLIFSVWGVPYYMALYGFTKSVAAGIVSVLFIGWMVGSPLSGWLSDYIGKRKPIMLVSSVGTFFAITAAIFIPNLDKTLLIILMFAFGLFSSGFLMSFATIKENNAHAHSGAALGFMNTINSLGGAAIQPIVGVILDCIWQGEFNAGIRFYSVGSYHIALAIIPVLVLISLLFLPSVKETFCHARA